ncbi:MAG: hypothetical protein N4Q56_02640 [Lactobacillus iners]|nr:hypothetical protein [Lactobacillus iners]
MAIIITMAGEGKRARKMFNTNLPKFEIKINNKSFFDRTLSSLKALRSELFIFVINNDEMEIKYEKPEVIEVQLPEVLSFEKMNMG